MTPDWNDTPRFPWWGCLSSLFWLGLAAFFLIIALN